MRYAGIIKNDTSAGDGICVTLFVQGCHRRCKGCHNPETWDFDGGLEYTEETQKEILEALGANGIQRNLCIMGGEPLTLENLPHLKALILLAKEEYKDLKVWLWTGYTFRELMESYSYRTFLDNVDVLIDGPYIEELRDITLPYRGSSNQNVYLNLGWSWT